MPKRSRGRGRDRRSRSRDDEYDAESWQPKKKGDSIAGEIVSMDIVEFDDRDAPVVILEDEDGDLWKIWCGTVLSEDLYDEYEVGDSVEITYKGKKGGGQYAKKMFKVEEA